MEKFTIECRLNGSREFLKESYGVKKIGYFGSNARNGQHRKSDINISIKLEQIIGFEFLNIMFYLEDKLGIQVDLITLNG